MKPQPMKLSYRLILLIIVSFYLHLPGIASAKDNANYTDIQIKNMSVTEQSGRFDFELEGLQQEELFLENQRYDRFSISGESTTIRENFPELPTIVRFVLVPPRSGIEVVINDANVRTIKDTHPVLKQPVIRDGESKVDTGNDLMQDYAEFTESEELGSDGFWPPEAVSLGKPSILRGYRIVKLAINPVRYNPQTRETQIIESVDFELDFNSNRNRVNLVENPGRKRPSSQAARLVDQLVMNPPSRDEGEERGSIIYMIGDWDDVEEELEPLVEWRRRMGWTVEVVRVVQSNNNAAVKEAIQEAYDEWEIPPEHVVLCGDTDDRYTMAFWDTRAGTAWPYETDHKYVELEGDDILPDAAIGRLVFTTTNMLRGIVNKTIRYESEPYIGDEDEQGWQKRAAFTAADYQSGTSSIDVCRWTKDLVRRNGFQEVDELYWTPQNRQPNARQFIIDNINDGISFFIYRGWTFMSGFQFADVDALRNGRMLPFVMLATCNTGDYGEHISSTFYYSERFNYHSNGGAIGAVGAAGATHTAYNNLITASTFKGVFVDGLYTQGWALMNGKVDLFRNYADRGDIDHEENPGLEAWLAELYIFNLMGDPAVDLFTDTPAELEVVHPEVLRIGESVFEIEVSYEDGEPASEAMVCLYKPGEFQIAEKAGADGIVTFNLDPELTQDGEIQLTVTGHNLMTYMTELEPHIAENFIGAAAYELDDDEEGASVGNGDGTANPTERIELSIEIMNFGSERPGDGMTIELEPVSPHLEVIEGHAEFEAAPEPDNSVQATFLIEIAGGFLCEEDAVFSVVTTVGGESWTSSITIPVDGAQLEFAGLEWEGEVLEPGGFAELMLTIRNIGETGSEQLSATLVSLTQSVEVPEPNGVFPPLEPDEEATSEGVFQLSANPFFIGGNNANLALILEAENGFTDTSYFSMVVGEGEDGRPFGADGYGYLCFDDTDEGWFMKPEFNWIEIDTALDGNGTDTGLNDRDAQEDASVLVDLPFTFTYYGEEFDQVTICTNGWIALGDHDELNTGRNRRIPSGMVGSAMICPFWDDLVTTNPGGIFYHFDEEEHIFIVEWSGMRKLGPRVGNEPTETFQVILFDPEFHPSFTGDGDIVFQYLDVTDDASAYTVWDTPFATVGIGSPDQTSGIQYTYWGDLTPGAAALEDERAIKFTTLVDFITGHAHGVVRDARSAEPIEGATIVTTYGFSATTDEDGYYFIQDILVDSAITYEFTARKEFYNDLTIDSLVIVPEETLRVDFDMLHPEFTLELEGIDVHIEQENANDFFVPIRNTGNGPLDFTSKIEFRDVDDNRDDLWEIFLEFNVTETAVGIEGEDTLRIGNSNINGVAFIDSMFYVTGGGDEGDNLPAKWYRFTRNGDFIDSLDQPWIDRRGLRGITSDGASIWGGYDNSHVYKFNLEDLSVVDSFEVPTTIPSDVAIDPERGVLYTCGITSHIFAFDTSGTIIDSWDPFWDGNRIRKYGLAWYSDQPDSLKLLIFADFNGSEYLFGFNPLNEDVQLLADLTMNGNDRPTGIDVSSRWNSSVWTLITSVSNADGDRIIVHELDPNTTWLNYSPIEGTLAAGEDTTMHIRVEAGLRPVDRYWLVLEYRHNAYPGFQEIPIVMQISEQSGVILDAQVPDRFTLEQNWPNPFNSATTIRYSLEQGSRAKLSVFDIQGRLIDVIQDGYQDAGTHRVTFDASNLPNGVYICRLENEIRSASRKMLLLR